MGQRWSVDRVVATAPDSASEVAGRKLANPGPWSEVGHEGAVLWGQCRGSARTPYRVVVDTDAPRYECSCPSTKFPCKHALALLFLWAQDRLPDDEAAPQAYARNFLEPRSPVEPAAKDPEEVRRAAAERARQRDERVAVGLAELQQWLADQVRTGLSRLASSPAEFDQLAARMVDAQAPGVARWIRSLETIPATGTGWPERLLAELGQLWWLAEAMRNRAHATEPELTMLRTHLGYPAASAEVLAEPGVRDDWVVFGLHDADDDDRVQTRRVWLLGQRTGRYALVLFFSVNGAPFEMTMAPGMLLDAELHFHNTALPLRALVGRRFDDPLPAVSSWPMLAHDVAGLREAYAAALAVDPWLRLWPTAIRGRLVHLDDDFALVGDDGSAVTVVGPETLLWKGLVVVAGAPANWLGEWDGAGFNPLAVVDNTATDGRLVVL
ncbi:SWIM zinc finger family protein [Naumannella sp. ID2617S]|nr:SWIM zinc finger family protein [Naumannella sp. ID2617S]